jgi:hypothetical protein
VQSSDKDGGGGKLTALSRTPVVIGAVVCGLTTLIGISASLYTHLNTPGLEQVPIYIDGKIIRTESKLIFLWVYPIFQILAFLVLLACGSLGWSIFSHRLRADEEYYRVRMGWSQQLDVQSLLEGVCAAFCVIVGAMLLLNIEACLSLLRQP